MSVILPAPVHATAPPASLICYGRREALDYAPDALDVTAIRARLGLSQTDFALRFGFDLRAVENSERGRRQPERPTRAFPRVIEPEPEAVIRALTKRPADAA